MPPAVNDLLRSWRSTRMVVLTAVSAALYAAVLIPFKAIPIVPGATELRPANALPIVFSFLFGPAGAWGSALGNLIGDTFGTLGPGTLFGFAGNLLYGYLPYRLWSAWSKDAVPRGVAGWTGYAAVVAAASAACALVIGWGLNLLGFVPFRVLGTVILANNLLMSLLLSPFLLKALHPRIRRWGLLYTDILDPPAHVRPLPRRLAGAAAGAAALLGFAAGHLAIAGGGAATAPGDAVTLTLFPFVAALVVFGLMA
jgi:energy-coupling factor transport system substrate-specific component